MPETSLSSLCLPGHRNLKVADIMSDVKLTFADTGIENLPGKVHSGFKDALHEIWTDLLATLKQFQDNQQTLWFCGHSLGGALATLAVAELIGNNKIEVNGLYTIGQPRVGDSKFAKHFDLSVKGKCFRLPTIMTLSRNCHCGAFCLNTPISATLSISTKQENLTIPFLG